jgi:N-methylhydantoinase A/oxoprolinase/acetone carboxylase beta subunit
VTEPRSTATVRVGVDVGGTFTKAVAVELPSGLIAAQAVLPTSHQSPNGVAEGIIAAVADVADKVGRERVHLVTHSTTQAVNALLEGDVLPVGVLGLGREPDLRKARKRTMLAGVVLAPGKRLATEPVFVDVTRGLPVEEVERAFERFRARGVGSVCVAEAFAPDDDQNEATVAKLAAEAGFVVCTSTELSGLYGLELRTVTAAVNASILPIAIRTAQFVADGVASAQLHAQVMVMRGDGGATDLDGFRSAPVRTLYSGPAASVAGALRYTNVTDGIVVEVGGTSTNIAAVRDGRPLLSYVKVASHATAIRAVDVRVIGVAGGSMLRLHRRGVYAVGPRSAHIAGLPYAGYLPPDQLGGARLEIAAPRADDPPDYAIVRLADGSAAALTTTCAANALGVTRPGDYAHADPDAAKAAFDLVGEHCRIDGSEVARRMLVAAGEAVCDEVWPLMRQQHLRRPVLVAVGGGAGGLARHVAAMLELPIVVPEGAEVISSLGDALSHVRAERERTVVKVDGATLRALSAEVEAEAARSGADSASIEVRIEEHPERGTVRAIATGAVALAAGAVVSRSPVDEDDVRAHAGTATVRRTGMFWIVQAGPVVTILDRYGEQAAQVRGEVAEAPQLDAAYRRHVRYRGPVTLRPIVYVVAGSRLTELSNPDAVEAALALGADEPDNTVFVTYVVGRST